MNKYKAMVIAVGVVNIPSGITAHKWSIYENKGLHAFLCHDYLLFGTPTSLDIGDDVELISNDTNRRLGKTDIVKDSAPCVKEELLAMLLKHGFDYYPARAFQKKRFNNKLRTSYSIKGVTQA